MPKNLGLQYMLLVLRFLRFLRFFENPKNVTFYVFFAFLHTFSRTMPRDTKFPPYVYVDYFTACMLKCLPSTGVHDSSCARHWSVDALATCCQVFSRRCRKTSH